MNKVLTAITSSICSIVATATLFSATALVGAQSNNYDVNQDGKANIMDMISLKQFLLRDELQNNSTQDIVTVGFENITTHNNSTIAAVATIINNTDTGLIIQPTCVKVIDSNEKTYVGGMDLGMGMGSVPDILEPNSITGTTAVICPLANINDIRTIEIEFICYDSDTMEFVTNIGPITLYINENEEN